MGINIRFAIVNYKNAPKVTMVILVMTLSLKLGVNLFDDTSSSLDVKIFIICDINNFS